MSAVGLIFLIILVLGIFSVSRRFVLLILASGYCYLPIGLQWTILGINMPAVRILLLAGALRALTRGDLRGFERRSVDTKVALLCAWMLCASPFHHGLGEGPIFMVGVTAGLALAYFLTRVYCRNPDEFTTFAAGLSIVLVPVALEMIAEKVSGINAFGILENGASSLVIARNGSFRAQGAFSHPILAGTIGAGLIGLMVSIYKSNRKLAIVGIASCLLMIATSASSGPIMSLMVTIIGISAWKKRRETKWVVPAACCAYAVLSLLMTSPPYYLLARIDLSGGSTGWHRARLIESSIEHLKEWWLVGTDVTRHWMPTGLYWDDIHADMTNYYLQIGVWGGLVAMFLFISILRFCFKATYSLVTTRGASNAFLIWCVACSIFSFAVSSISVGFFGQAFAFIWLVIGLAVSLLEHARLESDVEATEPKAWVETGTRVPGF